MTETNQESKHDCELTEEPRGIVKLSGCKPIENNRALFRFELEDHYHVTVKSMQATIGLDGKNRANCQVESVTMHVPDDPEVDGLALAAIPRKLAPRAYAVVLRTYSDAATHMEFGLRLRRIEEEEDPKR